MYCAVVRAGEKSRESDGTRKPEGVRTERGGGDAEPEEFPVIIA